MIFLIKYFLFFLDYVEPISFSQMDQRILARCFLDFKSVTIIPRCVVCLWLDFVGLNYFSEKVLYVSAEFNMLD